MFDKNNWHRLGMWRPGISITMMTTTEGGDDVAGVESGKLWGITQRVRAWSNPSSELDEGDQIITTG